MARYNEAISVTFNENDGGVGWSANPECVYNIARYRRTFGIWRTRWILFKRFWRAMRWMEDRCEVRRERRWVFRAEIPE